MTEEQPKKEYPQLIKQSTIYKLIVPAKVEEKIRYLLRKFPNTEWSGVLFTTHEGTFEGNDLVITCQDIYPMDLGNATYTQFKMNEDVAAYMANNIELFDCDLQLIHSHHTMSTFFSGTDINTLREEGDERNCFVSLIVNNAGVYNAAITRKIQAKHEVTIKQLGKSYEFFGEGEKQMPSEESQTTKVVDKEIIEYFMLDVERETVDNPFDYLDTRFEEIISKKVTPAAVKSKPLVTTANSFIWANDRKSDTVEEPTLFDKKTMDDLKVEGIASWQPDPNVIHRAVVYLITLSLITPENVDLKQWIAKHMQRIYKERFLTDNSFNNWAEFFIEHIIEWCMFADDTLTQEILDSDKDDETAIVTIASAMIDELYEFSDNSYVKDYMDILERYMYE